MNTPSSENHMKIYARLTGFAYLIIICCGLFSELFARGTLIVKNDMSATASNILANTDLLRLAVVSDITMLLSDVIVAVLLYVLLKHVNKPLALFAIASRLIMNAILGAYLLSHYHAIHLLNKASDLSGSEQDHLFTLASMYLEAHSTGYAIALVYFAFHCLALACLLYRAEYFPRILGVLIGFASISYFIDSFSTLLLPAYDTANQPWIMLPALIAELSLCLWLIFKGIKQRETVEQIQQNTSHALQ